MATGFSSSGKEGMVSPGVEGDPVLSFHAPLTERPSDIAEFLETFRLAKVVRVSGMRQQHERRPSASQHSSLS